jgi:hypothetical protein
MHIVEVHQAEPHLARLVEETAAGNPIIIARSGNSLAMPSAYTDMEVTPSRTLWTGTVKGDLSRHHLDDANDA